MGTALASYQASLGSVDGMARAKEPMPGVPRRQESSCVFAQWPIVWVSTVWGHGYRHQQLLKDRLLSLSERVLSLLSFSKTYLFLFMCMYVCLCLYVYHVCAGAYKGQKRASDLLQLEL